MKWTRSNPLGERAWASAPLLLSLLVACGNAGEPTVPVTPQGSGAASGAGGSAVTGGAGGSAGSSGGASPTGGMSGTPGAGGSLAGAGGTGGTLAGGAPNLGDPVIPNKGIHRLSNVEYDNTLRDLLQTDVHFGESFVEEEAHGFDNIATALSMS